GSQGEFGRSTTTVGGTESGEVMPALTDHYCGGRERRQELALHVPVDDSRLAVRGRIDNVHGADTGVPGQAHDLSYLEGPGSVRAARGQPDLRGPGPERASQVLCCRAVEPLAEVVSDDQRA